MALYRPQGSVRTSQWNSPQAVPRLHSPGQRDLPMAGAAPDRTGLPDISKTRQLRPQSPMNTNDRQTFRAALLEQHARELQALDLALAALTRADGSLPGPSQN